MPATHNVAYAFTNLYSTYIDVSTSEVQNGYF